MKNRDTRILGVTLCRFHYIGVRYPNLTSNCANSHSWVYEILVMSSRRSPIDEQPVSDICMFLKQSLSNDKKKQGFPSAFDIFTRNLYSFVLYVSR